MVACKSLITVSILPAGFIVGLPGALAGYQTQVVIDIHYLHFAVL